MQRCRTISGRCKTIKIYHLAIIGTHLQIQSLVEFCRDNTHLKVLAICHTIFSDDECPIPVPSQEEAPYSSAVLVLDRLTVEEVEFKNSTRATEFSNFIAHVTYSTLDLGGIIVGGDEEDEDKKSARMRILSELMNKSSVQQITFLFACPIEVMDVIEACASVTQIQLNDYTTCAFHSAAGNRDAKPPACSFHCRPPSLPSG